MEKNKSSASSMLNIKREGLLKKDFDDVQFSKNNNSIFCWKKRTRLEKCLIFILVMLSILLISSIFLLPLFYADRNKLVESIKNRPCLSKECISAGYNIQKYVNNEINPCEDFYNFACGKWDAEHPIPQDQPAFTQFRRLEDEVFYKIHNILMSETINSNYYVNICRKFYQSCINEELIDKLGNVPIKQLIFDLGGWPFIYPVWKKDLFDLSKLIAITRFMQPKVFFEIEVLAHEFKQGKHALYLNSGELGLQRLEYYLNPAYSNILSAYTDYIRNVIKEINDKTWRLNMEEDLEDMIKFEIRFANVSQQNEYPLNITNIGNLENKISKLINWKEILQTIYQGTNIIMNDSQEVYIYNINNLIKQMEVINNTSKRTLANYIIWRIIESKINALPFAINQNKLKLDKILLGITVARPRWYYCVQVTNSYMGEEIGKMYVEKFVKESTMTLVLGIFMNIRESLVRVFEASSWMSNEAKTAALRKLKHMKTTFGFLNYIKNDSLLNYDRLKLKLTSKSFLNDYLEVEKFTLLKNFQKLKQSIDDKVWNVEITEINAYMAFAENRLIIPAGLFQFPFLYENTPMYLNYGGIGSIIGHELMHGYDETGNAYDENGNQKNWWSSNDKKLFKEKIKCFIDQYNKYEVLQVNLSVNGQMTSKENFADNVGLSLAFKTYKNLFSNDVIEKSLPNLSSYSNDHLFFINFAQIWCGNYRTYRLIDLVQNNLYTPGQFRVNGVLSNMKEFSSAFNCPINSPMNPINKCSIW